MNKLTPEQQAKARELFEMMGGEKPEKKNWASLIVLFLLLMGFIAIIVFAPVWAKVVTTLFVIYRLVTNWKKIKR